MIKQIELEPTIIAQDCGVEIVGYTPRVYKLHHGDIFALDNVAVKKTFGMKIKHIKCGEKINQCFICTEKTKRKHWWQFWKPKYVFANFVYIDKEN